MNRNPYEVLGISENASEEDLKNAYRYLARKFEEDKNAGPPLSDIASKKLEELNQAYDEIIRLRADKSSYSYGNKSSYGGYTSNNPYANVYTLLDEQNITKPRDCSIYPRIFKRRRMVLFKGQDLLLYGLVRLCGKSLQRSV